MVTGLLRRGRQQMLAAVAIAHGLSLSTRLFLLESRHTLKHSGGNSPKSDTPEALNPKP